MTVANADLVFYVELRVKRECIEQWPRTVDEIIDRMSEEDAFVACYLDQDPRNAEEPRIATVLTPLREWHRQEQRR